MNLKCVYIYTYKHLHTFVCVYIYTYIYIYVYMYIYVKQLNQHALHLKVTQHCKSTKLPFLKQWKK